MAFLSNSVVCGPGSIADAHTDNERVSREQFNRAVDVYHGFLVRRDAANG